MLSFVRNKRLIQPRSQGEGEGGGGGGGAKSGDCSISAIRFQNPRWVGPNPL